MLVLGEIGTWIEPKARFNLTEFWSLATAAFIFDLIFKSIQIISYIHVRNFDLLEAINHSFPVQWTEFALQVCNNKLTFTLALRSIDDRFGTEMNAFLEYANDEYEKLEATYTNMGKCVAEIITFYGEDPKKTNPEEFFSDIVTFCNDFEVNIIRTIVIQFP